MIKQKTEKIQLHLYQFIIGVLLMLVCCRSFAKFCVSKSINPVFDVSTNVHMVCHGESLSAIALRHFGRARVWPMLWQANSGSVANPHLIYPGQRISLNVYPESVIHPTALSSMKTVVKFMPRIDLHIKKGNKRNMARVGFLLPVLQNQQSLLFVTAYGMLDNRNNHEGNFGLGYRQLRDSSVYGGYGYYDLRKSENGNMFHQLTVGAEWFMGPYELRGNVYYVPGEQKKILRRLRRLEVEYIGHRTASQTSTRNIFERPMGGFDVELGRDFFNERVKAFGAYYHFGAAGLTSVNGFRVRGEYAITRYLSVEGESSRDRMRGWSNFVGMKLSVKVGGNKQAEVLSGLERKMTQLPVRDIDIIHDTGIDVKEEEKLFEEAFSPVVGTDGFDEVIDKSVGGKQASFVSMEEVVAYVEAVKEHEDETFGVSNVSVAEKGKVKFLVVSSKDGGIKTVSEKNVSGYGKVERVVRANSILDDAIELPREELECPSGGHVWLKA